MRFVRAVWKLLVGIKDALVLLFMPMFFGVLYAWLSAKPAAIHDGVLAMDLDGVLVEQASRPDPFATVAGAGNVTREFELRDLIAALDTAKDDSRVRRSRRPRRLPGRRAAAIAALGEKIRGQKSKPVIAFAAGYIRPLIAAHASEI
jgi:protease-4